MRFFTLGRKLAHLSLQECHKEMMQCHAPLVLACKGFRDHCLNYRQNHFRGSVSVPNGELQSQADPAFHYCSEFWYEDADALISAYHGGDYFRTLRPDVMRWSDAAARLAFLAEEVWVTGPQQPPVFDGSTKIFVLHAGAADAEAATSFGQLLPERYPGFFNRCLRTAHNRVSGQMDFERARIRDQVDLPFHALSELWFESSITAQEALSCNDGRRLMADKAWLPAEPGQGVMLWATERVIF